MHAAVTTTPLGVVPQLGKLEGLTVKVMILGSAENTSSVTGETDGVQVKASVPLPDP